MTSKKIGRTVVVFDANSSEEFKRQAIDCYREITERYLFCSELSEDKSCIFLTNARRSDRDVTNFFASDYAICNPSQCRYMEEAIGTKGNWIRGVELAAIHLRHMSNLQKGVKYHILVFTDFKTLLDMDRSEISEIMKNISDSVASIQGNIYFLGPNLRPETMLRTLPDVRNWMMSFKPRENPTRGLEIALKIVQKCSGVIYDFKLGPDLYFAYTKANPPLSYFDEPLNFGELVSFKTAVVGLMGDVPGLATQAQKDVESSKFVLSEDREVVVEKEDVIDGFLTHDQLIIIPKEVMKGVRNHPRYFKLLGFTDQSNVPPHYIRQGKINLLRNHPKHDPSSEIINYVIEAAAEHNKVGIAIRSYTKDSRPVVFCLIPKTKPHYFLMVRLPFADEVQQPYKEQDINTFVFKKPESDCDSKSSEDLKSEIYQYLDSIDVDKKIELHPHLRMSDSMKRATKMFTQKREGKPMEEAPLLPFGIDLKSAELPENLKKKLKTVHEKTPDSS